MKEGLIASSYECPKCNDRHDVTWSAIKRFLRNRTSHAECKQRFYKTEKHGKESMRRKVREPLLYMRNVISSTRTELMTHRAQLCDHDQYATTATPLSGKSRSLRYSGDSMRTLRNVSDRDDQVGHRFGDFGDHFGVIGDHVGNFGTLWILLESCGSLH
ncbi:hypothetical protein TNCV_988541 [Trichonephila clavipes]|nr:hypothetical protein TNCV_988541 [Trichonephila clavipes]